MPVLKHAKKKLRQDKKRTIQNKKIKDLFKKLVKEAKDKKTAESLSAAFSGIDKAAKKFILNKNKAARMKSSLAKIVEGKVTVHAPKKAVAKKAVGKKAPVAKKASAKKKK